MKILMAGYLPFDEAGGMRTAMLNLAKNLVEKGIEVTMISPGSKDLIEEINGIQVIYKKEFKANFKNNLKIMGTQKSYLAAYAYKKIFHDILEKADFDVFHAHGGNQLSVGPIFAAKELKIPSMITLHAHWPVCFNYKLYWNGGICDGCNQLKFIKCTFHEDIASILMLPLLLALKNKSMAMRRKALGEADKLVTVSKYLKDILMKFGFDGEKITPLYNILQPKRSRNHECLPYFCWSGRVVMEKGLKYALYALQKVVYEHPEAKLIIIGDGASYDLLSEKKRLIRLSKKLGLSKNVIFTGWKPNDEVIDIISKSTAVVFPSLGPEIFPMAVLEGMGCGKPVIVTNRGGIPEIIEDGNNGFLVPPHDSKELAREMIYLLDNPNEEKRIGQNAFETVKRKCNPDIIANEHIKLYKRLVEED